MGAAFLKDVRVIPSYGNNTCYLSWDLMDSRLSSSTLRIFKSANGAEWQLIDEVVAVAGAYEDVTHNVRNRVATYFYKFELIHNSSVFVSETYSPIQLDSLREMGIVNFIVNEELKYMRHGGSHVAVLKIKTSGTPCPDCVDPETGQRLKEYCSTCHGTGYINGYYPPIMTYVRILNEKNEGLISDNDSGAKIQKIERTFRVINIPFYEAGDIIVDLKTDDRYQVSPLQKFEFRGLSAVIAHLDTELLNRDHPAYSLLLQTS